MQGSTHIQEGKCVTNNCEIQIDRLIHTTKLSYRMKLIYCKTNNEFFNNTFKNRPIGETSIKDEFKSISL